MFRKLLIISPTPTHPTNAGNRARVRSWLELCVETGLDFHFVFFRHEPGDEAAMIHAWGADRCTFLDYKPPRRHYPILARLRRRLARAMRKTYLIPYRIDDWRCESLVNEVRLVAERIKPDCVQVEYVFFSHLFECFDKAVFKILDTHDIVAGRQRMFLKHGREPEWFYTTRRQEAIGVTRSDYVVAIQEREREYFKTMTRRPVATVGHMVELVQTSSPATRPTVVFMGSFNRVNQDALVFLLERIWPLVRGAVPDVSLEVYGSVCGSASPSATCGMPEVRLEGVIADVSQAYERAWVVICPLRFGTGLKIKSIEALGRGKALVATPAGCTGIEDGQDSAFVIGNSAEEVAGHCIEVLTNASLRNRLEQGAHEYAAAWNLKQRNAFLTVMEVAGLL